MHQGPTGGSDGNLNYVVEDGMIFRRSTAALIALMLLIFIGGCKGKKRPRAVVGLEAPDFVLRDADGGMWRLSGLRGSVVLINFWASWCAPCLSELPAMQRLHESMKANRKFRLVTVLFRDEPLRAYHYMRQNGYTFPLLIDSSGDVSAAYGLTAVPETFLVDKKGVLREKFIGPVDFDSPRSISFVRGLVEE